MVVVVVVKGWMCVVWCELVYVYIPLQVCTILDSLQPNTTVTFKVTLYLINVVITFQQYTLLTHGYT